MASNRWTDGFLDSMRQVTDLAADNAVRTLFKEGEVGSVNTLMRNLVTNDQIPSEKLPQCIQDYLEGSSGLPDWADPGMIREAEDFFGRHGPVIGLLLLCASLPTCYAAAKGVQVLALTARLETNPTRRIGETAQMIIDVMAPALA